MKVNHKSMYNKDHFIIFDFETTGLDASDDVIEYAFLEFKNNILVDSISSLVKPTSAISELITSITGITNADVSNSDFIDAHVNKISNFIKGKDIVAHNVNFDLKFLMKMLRNKDVEVNAIDSLRVMRDNVKLEKYNLDFLKKHYNLTHQNHRAYDDCLIVKDILDIILK